MIESFWIKNKVTGKSVLFNMDDANYLIYEGAVDWGTIDVKHNTSQFPQQIGNDIVSTIINDRDISINAWVIGDSALEIENKKKAISAHINPLQDLEIICGNYSITCRPTDVVKFSSTEEENNDVMCKMLISLVAPFPLFQSYQPIDVSIADIEGKFGFPLMFKKTGVAIGVRKSSLFADVANDGDVPIGMEIIFNATGQVNNPELMNVNTHERIRINKSMEAGEQIIINTLQGKRSVKGNVSGEEKNYFGYFDYDNVWLQLDKGMNTFTYHSYSNGDIQDESYKKLNVSIKFKQAVYNLGGM